MGLVCVNVFAGRAESRRDARRFLVVDRGGGEILGWLFVRVVRGDWIGY